MSLFSWDTLRKPIEWARGKSGSAIASAQRQAESMGPLTDIFGKWEPRTHQPWLYEALRESLGILDAGIHNQVTLDGIVRVEGGNDKIIATIEDWMRNVQVNDLQTGYQAFYAGIGAEHYEQGIGIGEYELDAKARDVVRLRVADSKGIAFTRDNGVLRTFYCPPTRQRDFRSDGLGSVQALLRSSVQCDVFAGLRQLGFVELDPAQCVFALHRPEADNPYGTSLLRSIPFVAQILLKMENAVGNSWTRWGDPTLHVHYSTKNRKIDSAEAKRRADAMANDLAKAMQGRQRGNSVDLATAAAADDDVKIDVVGAGGAELEIEEPARHLLEQIVAALDQPAWMLGISWTQAAGVGEPQAEMLLQKSKTRFELRRPGLAKPVEAMLRARGIAWKRGDWELVQELPSLADMMKRAQAGFLNAQTALMLSNSGQVEPPKPGRGIDNNLRSPRQPHAHKGAKAAGDDEDDEAELWAQWVLSRAAKRAAKAAGDDEDDEAESWAEDDPELPLIEARTQTAMRSAWHKLRDAVLAALALQTAGEVFSFDAARLPELLTLGDTARGELLAALLAGQLDAWDRGIANAGLELSVDFSDADIIAAIGRARAAIREAFASAGLDLVRGGLARRYHTAIVGLLASGAYDGLNPVSVAAALRERFGAGDYNWLRLARSEVAQAQAIGKRDLLAQQGEEFFDWDVAPDGCPTCQAIKANGPYRVDDPLAPIPMRDTHPQCRCSIRPILNPPATP